MKCINCGMDIPNNLTFCRFCGTEIPIDQSLSKPVIKRSEITTILFFIPIVLSIVQLLLSMLGISPFSIVDIIVRFLSTFVMIALWISLFMEYRLFSYHGVRIIFILFGAILAIITQITNTIYMFNLVNHGPGYYTMTQFTTFSLLFQAFSIISYILIMVPLTMINFIKPRIKSISVLWIFYVLIPIAYIPSRVIGMLLRDNFEAIIAYNQVMNWLSVIPILVLAIVGIIRLVEQKQINN